MNRRQIESQFDRAAATYDSVAALQRRMGARLLQGVLDQKIDSAARIGDLGCGTGHLLAGLSAAGYRSLFGVDLSANMIEIARGHCRQAEYLHASIEAIPVDDGFFDGVISNAAIQWCEPALAALQIARVLRPGGHLLANTFVQGTLQQWEAAFEAVGIESRVHRLPCPADIGQAFTAAGFEQLSVKRVVETSRFDSLKAMLASIRRLGAGNASDSRRQPISKSQYLDLKRYFARQLKERGALELDFAWVEICGFNK